MSGHVRARVLALLGALAWPAMATPDAPSENGAEAAVDVEHSVVERTVVDRTVVEPGALVLTPEDAVARALARSPMLHALRARVDEGRPATAWNRGLNNPELRLGEFRSDRLISPLIDGTGYRDPFEDAELGVRWTPPAIDELGPEQSAAAAVVRRREAELAEEHERLAAEVLDLYATMRNLDERIALGQRQIELTADLRALIARQVTAGLATGLDESLAALEHLDARKDVEELLSERRLARHELIAHLGLAPDTVLVLTPPPEPWCRDPDRPTAELERVAVDASPRVRAISAEIDEVETRIGAAWLGLIPWIDFVQVGYVPGGGSQPDSVHARLSVDVPLLDWNQDDIARLRSERERHRYEALAIEERLVARVRFTAEELSSHRALLALEDEAAPMVESSLSELERALEAGEADPLELALLRNRLLRAQRARLKAQLRCERAHIDLRRITGVAPSVSPSG